MPAIGGSQSHVIQMLDFSGERRAIALPIGEITVVTITARLLQLQDINEAIDAVTSGTIAKTTTSLVDVISNTRPATAQAQIETEMLVSARDATTEQPFSFRIPTVNYSAFEYAEPPAGDSVILSGAGASAQTLALVTALEAGLRSPFNDANLVEILGMRVVE